MRRTVVVTFLGTLAACGKGNPDPGPVTHPEPPAPAPPPAGAPDPTTATRPLNAQHPEHGRIFRKQDATCYVHLPFPPEEGPPVSFRPPPMQDVPCPPSMTDPAWSECAYGSILANDDASACICTVMGNPPPPPRPTTCPNPTASGAQPGMVE